MRSSQLKYTIFSKATIKDALIELNGLSGDVLSLFVLDENEVLIGTVTDGDIRRNIVLDITLADSITTVMRSRFSFITEDNRDISYVNKIKKKGIKLLPLLDKSRKIIKIYNLQDKQSLLPIDAVLMAGGKGERLRPLTDNTPKPLLKVGEKAIIDYNIDNLIDFGVENISVTTNYLAEQLDAHFEKPINSVKVNCVREPKYLGTLGSIKFVENFYNDTVLVMNSDLFTNINLEDFFLHYKENGADMSIAAVPYSVSVPYGIFELDNNEIKGVKEKPTYNYYANSGIYLIKKELLDLIPDDIFFNATDMIELLISLNKKVIRFPLVGYWIDIGKPADYQKAQDFVKHL